MTALRKEAIEVLEIFKITKKYKRRFTNYGKR